MKISNTKSLRFLHVLGWLFSLMFIGKIIVNKHYLAFVELRVGSMIGLCLVGLFLFCMVSWFWQLKLSHRRIESSFGTPLFRKTNVYTDLKSIELFAAHIEVKNGPDRFKLAIGMQLASRPKPMVLFSGLKEDEERQLANYVKEILQATGPLPVNISDHFKELYQYQFDQAFSLKK
ncbi:MAG: hypothetical protein ACI8WB_000900 [Phenylobacterium sp.]|jgi:hypothetical protein